MNVFEPQQRALGLVDNPHRVELSGALEELVLPDVCANCGAASSETIQVRKVFFRVRRATDDPSYYVIAGVDAPFCGSCAARHREEDPGMTPLQRWGSTLMSQMAIPAVLAAAAALFCLKEALADPTDLGGGGVQLMGGLAIAFLLASFASWWASRSATKRLRVPAQSSITSAFDFSDDLSKIFDESRRLYAIRDGAFATAFESANRSRVWDPDAPAARVTRVRRNTLRYVVAAIAIAVALWGWLHP